LSVSAPWAGMVKLPAAAVPSALVPAMVRLSPAVMALEEPMLLNRL
jgi:hypothetical protein